MTQHHKESSAPHKGPSAAMPAEHARELAIVALLLAASIAAEALGARELGASLGGAAVALILPRTPTSARVAVVGLAVGLSMTLGGCGSTPVPARAACRGAAALIAAACEHVPETMGGEASP